MFQSEVLCISITCGASSASRSIPAHAGEPRGQFGVASESGVYPRPRGGTAGDIILISYGGGLSPPTRGNLVRRPPFVVAQGSIPAHAGEPDGETEAGELAEVYPRPRGTAKSPNYARKILAARAMSRSEKRTQRGFQAVSQGRARRERSAFRPLVHPPARQRFADFAVAVAV